MKDRRLLQLAQELEWLGCKVGHYGAETSGPAADILHERQRELLATADKVERELKDAIRFNLSTLVGVEYYSLEQAFDSIARLLVAVEDIKQSAAALPAPELPPKVRQFSRLVEDYVSEALPTAA